MPLTGIGPNRPSMTGTMSVTGPVIAKKGTKTGEIAHPWPSLRNILVADGWIHHARIVHVIDHHNYVARQDP